MRSFSLSSIIGLCVGIIVIDLLAYFWLQDITDLFPSPELRTLIDILFWIFTIGLVTAILVLKIRLDNIPAKRRNQLITRLYGLTVSSFIPKIIFVLVISLLYALNITIEEKPSKVVVPLVGLFSGVLPFAVVLYGIFKAVYRFKVYHVETHHKTWPKSLDGFKIVQLSDLHLGSFNHRYHVLEKAIRLVNELDADLIVLTGDLVNNYAWELEGWEHHFKRLKAGIAKFAVLGNHDYGDYSKWPTEKEKQDNFNKIKDFFPKTGFKLLMNQTEEIEIDGHIFNLIGIENWSHKKKHRYGNLQAAIAGLELERFSVLLSHDPDHWAAEVEGKLPIELTLAGHTHGMQMGFRFKNQQWSPIKYKFRYWAGLYQQKDQYLYVNRGLGWLGFPGRIGMRPEITCIELKSNGS